jgi:HNH endonuclease
MKGYKHLTSEQIREVLRRYQETKSTRLVADELGVTLYQVQHAIERVGMQLTGLRESACTPYADELRRWAREGIAISEMARRIGATRRTVARFLRIHEMERTPFVQVGSTHPRWKGGRMFDKSGYVLIYRPTHHEANRHGQVREHRVVMEQKLGRLLQRGEVVHHLDGNRANNHPDNLEVYENNALHLAETLAGQRPNWSPAGRARLHAKRHRRTRRELPASRQASSSDVQASPDTSGQSPV